MALSRREVEILSAKLLNGTISPAEQVQLNQWLDEQMEKDTYEVSADFAADAEQLRLRMLAKILHAVTPQRRRLTARRIRLSWQFAAALIMVMTVSLLFLRKTDDNMRTGVERTIRIEAEGVFAGGNNATLSLADGRTITLSDNQHGIIVTDQHITYRDATTPVVSLRESTNSSSEEMLTLTTPAGVTYRVMLPDGSDVWVNANSTLTYPSRFMGDERVVNVTGEAYFSIVKDISKPFKVRSKGQEIEVLGTEFNVTAYPDELETKTTLTKGAVQIVNLTAKTVRHLSPGQQSTIRGKATDIREVDTEQYAAWRNDFFYFNGLSAHTVFAQLARWYDIDIVYMGKIPTVRFFGMIERNRSLGSILKILGKSEVKFEVRQVGDRKQLVVLSE